MKTTTLPVIDRTYELTKWFMGHIARFPRSHRYGLGKRIEDNIYAILEGLVRSQYSPGGLKPELLGKVNVELEVLRFQCRLADELHLFPHTSYEYAAGELHEIGSMVGGWLKQQRQVKASSAD